jgi:hypothetical protein
MTIRTVVFLCVVALACAGDVRLRAGPRLWRPRAGALRK